MSSVYFGGASTLDLFRLCAERAAEYTAKNAQTAAAEEPEEESLITNSGTASWDIFTEILEENREIEGYTDGIPQYDPLSGSTEHREVQPETASYDILMNIYADQRAAAQAEAAAQEEAAAQTQTAAQTQSVAMAQTAAPIEEPAEEEEDPLITNSGTASWDIFTSILEQNRQIEGYVEGIPQYNPLSGSTQLRNVQPETASYDLLLNSFAQQRAAAQGVEPTPPLDEPAEQPQTTSQGGTTDVPRTDVYSVFIQKYNPTAPVNVIQV